MDINFIKSELNTFWKYKDLLTCDILQEGYLKAKLNKFDLQEWNNKYKGVVETTFKRSRLVFIIHYFEEMEGNIFITNLKELDNKDTFKNYPRGKFNLKDKLVNNNELLNHLKDWDIQVYEAFKDFENMEEEEFLNVYDKVASKVYKQLELIRYIKGNLPIIKRGNEECFKMFEDFQTWKQNNKELFNKNKSYKWRELLNMFLSSINTL